jgi:nucleoside-diphosphate-sugar epimerase
MRKVLVTGAAGFVGRHAVKRLLDAGDEVHGVDGVMTTIDKIDDGGAVNLSTGIFTSFIDFAKLAAGITGTTRR